MKKLTPLLLFFLTFQAYGLSLDDMISEIQNRGYSKEFRQFEEDRLEIEGTKIDLINRDGIDLEAQSDYLEDESREFDSTLSAKYDLFKYSAEYNHENGDTEKELIGIEKELKDIFFSERKYKSTVFSYDKKYRLNLQEEKIEEEVISLISLYKEYMDTKLELELKEKLRPGLVNDMKKLQKELELGSGTEFDYKYSQMLVDNSSADIKQLMDDLEKLKTDFYELYKIEVSGKDIENFKDIENLKKSSFQNIGERDVENSMFLLEKSRENYKYSKYDNKWPDITAGTFYDSVNDGWLISLGLNQKTF